MKDAQKPDHISLNSLVGRLKEGRFVIPDFQREFEWKPWDIRDLIRSIFLDYYIGSLLLWKGKQENFDALACEPIYAFQGQEDPEHIVLDGQQRLTALYYAVMAPNRPAPGRANRYLFFIRVNRFMDEAYDDAFVYDWTRAGEKHLRDTESQYANHMFPLAIVGRGGWDLFHWIEGYGDYWDERSKDDDSSTEEREQAEKHASDAASFGQHLKEITEQYQIAYIELERDLELAKVCDIFTQVNSKGVRLDVFDLVNALLKPKGVRLRHMWRKAAPKLAFAATERMNIYVLQVMSIIKQAYCSPKYLYYLLPGQPKTTREPDGSFSKQILIDSTPAFTALWQTSVESLERSITTIRHPQEYGAIAPHYIPYVSILSGSVESTSTRDFLDVRAWFEDDSAQPAAVSELVTRLQTLPLRQETRRGSSIYNGVFNMLVLRGARDWTTGKVPQYGDLDDHHIVTKDWAKDQPVGHLIDSIANRTPLSAETNRHVISNRLPNQYLPQMIKANGDSSVRAILASHLIEGEAFDILLRDPFTPADFEAFLSAREQTIRHSIERTVFGEQDELPADLLKLDQAVGEIEVGLRHLIDIRLGGKPSQLPPGVLAKTEERIQAIAAKDPAFDLAAYGTLASKLEYADLRDLQEVMTAKAQWARFEGDFTNKDSLTIKFDQLATLRNGLRHNRAVSSIAVKEGEAALMWFRHVLNKISNPA